MRPIGDIFSVRPDHARGLSDADRLQVWGYVLLHHRVVDSEPRVRVTTPSSLTSHPPPGAPQDAPLKGGATELVLMDARPLPKDHTQIGRRADVTFWLRPGGDPSIATPRGVGQMTVCRRTLVEWAR